MTTLFSSCATIVAGKIALSVRAFLITNCVSKPTQEEYNIEPTFQKKVNQENTKEDESK